MYPSKPISRRGFLIGAVAGASALASSAAALHTPVAHASQQVVPIEFDKPFEINGVTYTIDFMTPTWGTYWDDSLQEEAKQDPNLQALGPNGKPLWTYVEAQVVPEDVWHIRFQAVNNSNVDKYIDAVGYDTVTLTSNLTEDEYSFGTYDALDLTFRNDNGPDPSAALQPGESQSFWLSFQSTNFGDMTLAIETDSATYELRYLLFEADTNSRKYYDGVRDPYGSATIGIRDQGEMRYIGMSSTGVKCDVTPIAKLGMNLVGRMWNDKDKLGDDADEYFSYYFVLDPTPEELPVPDDFTPDCSLSVEAQWAGVQLDFPEGSYESSNDGASSSWYEPNTGMTLTIGTSYPAPEKSHSSEYLNSSLDLAMNAGGVVVFKSSSFSEESSLLGLVGVPTTDEAGNPSVAGLLGLFTTAADNSTTGICGWFNPDYAGTFDSALLPIFNSLRVVPNP